jgi:hypothetical protein
MKVLVLGAAEVELLVHAHEHIVDRWQLVAVDH